MLFCAMISVKTLIFRFLWVIMGDAFGWIVWTVGLCGILSVSGRNNTSILYKCVSRLTNLMYLVFHSHLSSLCRPGRCGHLVVLVCRPGHRPSWLPTSLLMLTRHCVADVLGQVAALLLAVTSVFVSAPHRGIRSPVHVARSLPAVCCIAPQVVILQRGHPCQQAHFREGFCQQPQ